MTKEMKAAAAQNEAKRGEDRRYLSYFLENEKYGLELLKVQEIQGCMGLIPVMQAPDTGRRNMALPKRARKKISGN